MRSDDIVNIMYRENSPRFCQGACAQRLFSSEKAMQGNKIRRQIAFAELRSAASSVGSRRKKLLDDHVKNTTVAKANGDSYSPDSNFSLQQACHKFVMTRVQVCHKFVMTRVQACSKLAAS
ncbi:hypothetical protein AVEN_111069-1 [Araneus ventricosus]|uniref:Uncharacterized protein n=1 Tax=Araneus ventricosus TaxID=182803 RepID=A0A4Y2DQ03_ARAVE|nr:hypothetical protein AVEN_111069-1 [Araneus ventricosus]